MLHDFFKMIEEKWQENGCREAWITADTFNMLIFNGSIRLVDGDARLFVTCVDKEGILNLVLSMKSGVSKYNDKYSSSVHLLSISWEEENVTKSYSFPNENRRHTPLII